MATGTAHGTNYALKNAPYVGTWPNAARCNSEVYCLSEEVYATASAGDAGSVLYMGKLPAGAVVLFTVVWPIDTASYGEGDAMTNAVTGNIGISGDNNLFGAFTDLNATATPQVIGVVPDGTTYTTTLDMALRAETDVLITTTGAQALTDTEGIAMKMFYTMAGQTY
jgi:hypothetical protein